MSLSVLLSTFVCLHYVVQQACDPCFPNQTDLLRHSSNGFCKVKTFIALRRAEQETNYYAVLSQEGVKDALQRNEQQPLLASTDNTNKFLTYKQDFTSDVSLPLAWCVEKEHLLENNSF